MVKRRRHLSLDEAEDDAACWVAVEVDPGHEHGAGAGRGVPRLGCSTSTCAPRMLVWTCCCRARTVITTADADYPMLMRLKMLVALPIDSRGIGSMVIVVSGTKRSTDDALDELGQNVPVTRAGSHRTRTASPSRPPAPGRGAAGVDTARSRPTSGMAMKPCPAGTSRSRPAATGSRAASGGRWAAARSYRRGRSRPW